MYPAFQPIPPLPPSPSRQNKVALQREYREKEGECFNTLRDIIKDLTGVELRTRQEILRKAIDILSTASELRGRGVQVGTLTAHEIHSSINHEATTSHIAGSTADYAIQSPLSYGWPYADLDSPSLYDFHDQQCYPTSDMDSALDQASPRGYGEGWSYYPRS